jgi:hypothetical protein
LRLRACDGGGERVRTSFLTICAFRDCVMADQRLDVPEYCALDASRSSENVRWNDAESMLWNANWTMSAARGPSFVSVCVRATFGHTCIHT